jgi:hypothetical protein
MLKNKGASILEAMISSFIIGLAALAYGQLQVQSFTQILLNERLEKVSYSASDFSTKMIMNITNRGSQSEKDDIVDIYFNLPWDLTPNTCNHSQSYILDCLNLNLDDQLVCDINKSILVDMYNVSCDTFTSAPSSNINIEYCDASVNSMCFWINMDGIIRNELTCRENKNNCILMEIKI